MDVREFRAAVKDFEGKAAALRTQAARFEEWAEKSDVPTVTAALVLADVQAVNRALHETLTRLIKVVGPPPAQGVAPSAVESAEQIGRL